jgi:hypothetical protein
MVFAGMLPWFLFSTILGEASNSLVGNANLVGKVYFPRLIIPASSAVVALVDFAINLAILFGLMLWYRFAPNWHSTFLPAFVALAMLASLGPAFLTGISAISSRSSFNSGSTSRRLGFPAPSYPKVSASGTASTRWLASSTASDGASWVGRARCMCRGSCLA